MKPEGISLEGKKNPKQPRDRINLTHSEKKSLYIKAGMGFLFNMNAEVLGLDTLLLKIIYKNFQPQQGP